MKEKGGELEDSVADYFRRSGFDVQARVKMRDRFDVFHEIDVLASKREDYGTIQIAVECKHVQSSRRFLTLDEEAWDNAGHCA